MGVFCCHCELVVSGGLGLVGKHVSTHAAPYICVEGDCRRRKFQLVKTFKRHLRDHHQDALNSDDSEESASESSDSMNLRPADSEDQSQSDCESFAEVDDNNEDSGDYSGQSCGDGEEVNDEDFKKELQRSGALFILNLRKRGNVPASAVNVVVKETLSLIMQVMDIVKTKIRAKLQSKISETITEELTDMILDFSVGDPFKHLKNKNQQFNYFEEHFGFVRPESKFIKWRYDTRFNRASATFIPKQIPCTFIYMSLIKTLTVLHNIDTFYNLVHQEKRRWRHQIIPRWFSCRKASFDL